MVQVFYCSRIIWSLEAALVNFVQRENINLSLFQGNITLRAERVCGLYMLISVTIELYMLIFSYTRLNYNFFSLTEEVFWSQGPIMVQQIVI